MFGHPNCILCEISQAGSSVYGESAKEQVVILGSFRLTCQSSHQKNKGLYIPGQKHVLTEGQTVQKDHQGFETPNVGVMIVAVIDGEINMWLLGARTVS